MFGGGQAYEKGFWHGNFNFPVQSHQWLGGLFLFETLASDPGTSEALAEAEAYLLRRNTQEWGGHYGSRMQGWPADNLLLLAMRSPSGPCLKRAKDTLAAYEAIEKKHGAKGFVVAPGTAWAEKNWPDVHQGWQEAIVLSAAARYVMETGDQRFIDLIRRMTNHLLEKIYIPSSTEGGGFRPAKVYEFYAEGHVRGPSIHLSWFVLDGLIHGAHILTDERSRLAASDLMRSVARFHNEPVHQAAPDPANPQTFGAIAFRMFSYPGSESKIMGNIGRTGHAYFWFELAGKR
jgi:hypothetical protein